MPVEGCDNDPGWLVRLLFCYVVKAGFGKHLIVRNAQALPLFHDAWFHPTLREVAAIYSILCRVLKQFHTPAVQNSVCRQAVTRQQFIQKRLFGYK